MKPRGDIIAYLGLGKDIIPIHQNQIPLVSISPDHKLLDHAVWAVNMLRSGCRAIQFVWDRNNFSFDVSNDLMCIFETLSLKEEIIHRSSIAVHSKIRHELIIERSYQEPSCENG